MNRNSKFNPSIVNQVVQEYIINPQHACMRGLQYSVCLSVSLSTSDFEDDDVFTFETGMNVN